MLDLSRIGRVVEHQESVDLNEVVEEISSDLYAMMKERGGRLKSDQMPVVEGPRVRLRQVFQNLVSNGFRYNQSPEPKVEIRCYTMPGGYCFMVRDNGIGIAPENLGRIFEVFQRVDAQQKGNGNSSGNGSSGGIGNQDEDVVVGRTK